MDLSKKSVAIQLLEDKIEELEKHNFNLVVYNNELLLRARNAEGRVRELEEAAEAAEDNMRSEISHREYLDGR